MVATASLPFPLPFLLLLALTVLLLHLPATFTITNTAAAATVPPTSSVSSTSPAGLTDSLLTVGGKAAQAVLEHDKDRICSLILITDSSPALHAAPLVQTLRASTQGPAVVMVVDKAEGNLTDSFTHLLPLARQVRLKSWCTRVLVVSHDVAFLAAFARWSLSSRLLAWAVRLLVLTSLAPPHLLVLMPSSWTFAWMNTVFVNVDEATPGEARCDLFSFLPFTPADTRVVRVASWTRTGGLVFRTHLPLFPDKYSSFHGAEINVTARPFLPFWGETQLEGASDTPAKQFYGPDYHQLEAVAQALNFTFRIVPAESWEKVEDLVESRVCLVVAVGYIVLSTRLKRHDYTVTFLLDGNTFAMARPSLKSDWLAVFRPLSLFMWGAVVGSLLLVALVLWVLLGERAEQMASRSGRGGGHGREKGFVTTKKGRVRTEEERVGREELRGERRSKGRGREEEEGTGGGDGRRNAEVRESQPAAGVVRGARGREDVSFWATLQTLTGLLVGQGLPQRLTRTSSSRLVVATWLVFAYLVVAVYNGNLTATLTVPTYPPRPETLAELVAATDRLTMKSYLTGLCEVLLKSSSPIQNAVAQKMVVVSSTEEALQDVLNKREAYVDNNSFLRYTIAERFTHKDGSTLLYLVRERVFPSYLGLLVPHDAPYTPNLNRWLQAIVESGMYIKWTEDVVRQTRVKSQQRKREDATKQEEAEGAGAEENRDVSSEGGAVALNPTHLQGAFAVLFCGVSLALLAFALEVTSRGKFMKPHQLSSRQ